MYHEPEWFCVKQAGSLTHKEPEDLPLDLEASGDLHWSSFEVLKARTWLWQVQERMGGEVVAATSRASLQGALAVRRAGK